MNSQSDSNTPRIVAPQEARDLVERSVLPEWSAFEDPTIALAHTVATEPERIAVAVSDALSDIGDCLTDQGHSSIEGETIARCVMRVLATEPERIAVAERAAVVKALREQAARLRDIGFPEAADEVASDAAAIESGADW